jgi:hypothetical protein
MVDTDDFYKNVDVKFEGDNRIGHVNVAEGYSKLLQGSLDYIMQRLPDCGAFKLPGHIYFSNRESIVVRWEDELRTNSYHLQPQYLEQLKSASERLVNYLRTDPPVYSSDPEALEARDWTLRMWKMYHETPDYPVGVSVPLTDKDELSFTGYIIDIVADGRIQFRSDDCIRGIICHEIVEFTTKWNVWQEHKNEIKKRGDLEQVLRKYLKSGYYPLGKERFEHEEIVNREIKRLGFEKEIEAVENKPFSLDHLSRPSS